MNRGAIVLGKLQFAPSGTGERGDDPQSSHNRTTMQSPRRFIASTRAMHTSILLRVPPHRSGWNRPPVCPWLLPKELRKPLTPVAARNPFKEAQQEMLPGDAGPNTVVGTGDWGGRDLICIGVQYIMCIICNDCLVTITSCACRRCAHMPCRLKIAGKWTIPSLIPALPGPSPQFRHPPGYLPPRS